METEGEPEEEGEMNDEDGGAAAATNNDDNRAVAVLDINRAVLVCGRAVPVFSRAVPYFVRPVPDLAMAVPVIGEAVPGVRTPRNVKKRQKKGKWNANTRYEKGSAPPTNPRVGPGADTTKSTYHRVR